MSRFMMLGAAALAALTISPITTAAAQDIVVTGPRIDVTRESGSMLQTSIMTDSTLVSYSDIDLRTPGGRDLLLKRVNQAARHTCNRLDDLQASNVPLTGPGTDYCMTYAMAAAKPQIQRAVALYGGW